MSLSKRIKELREAQGWLQKELAHKINVSPEAVSCWESGKRSPAPIQRTRLCEVFEISEAELFGASTVNEPPPVYGATQIQHIPLLSWETANGITAKTSLKMLSTEGFITTPLNEKGVFALKIQDQSTQPEFTTGDIVVIRLVIQAEHGDYVLVSDQQSKEATLRVFNYSHNQASLLKINREQEHLNINESSRVHILGKVIKKIKFYA